MKKIILISILLTIALLIFSCQEKPKVDEKDMLLNIESFDNGVLRYTLKDNKDLSYNHLIHIVGQGIEESKEKEFIDLKGIPNLSGESLRVEVHGEIRNFEIVEITFEQDIEGNMVEKQINSYDEIRTIKNKVLLIDTYFSEGLPSGKLKWESTQGKVYDYYFTQDGYGINGEIILSE